MRNFYLKESLKEEESNQGLKFQKNYLVIITEIRLVFLLKAFWEANDILFLNDTYKFLIFIIKKMYILI